MTTASRELLLLLLAGALAGGQIVAASASLAASTDNPGNTLGTGTSAWFSLNVSGATLCTGLNATVACPFGTRPAAGTTVATATLAAKAASTYRVAVVDGTGPTGISTIVTASFRSTGATTAALLAGATDSLDLTLKIKGNTPTGMYTGTITVTDALTGVTASVSISVTH